MAYNSGTLKHSDPGAVIDSTVHSRRLYNFSDRVADLAPDESPFFVYLSKVAKVPTDDPQFRFLEDRNKIAITDRAFLIQAAVTLSAAGSLTTVTFDTAGGASVDWLVKGMVIAIGEDDDSTNQPAHNIVRVESLSDSGAYTTASVRTISKAGAASAELAVDDNTKCMVIGTSFEEGSGSPDVWSRELDNDYGYTQIFKTACELTNTARATRYRGYADEWQRIWNLKLREHKVDIERAMLFGQRASIQGIQYSEGIAGQIMKNSQSNAVVGGGQVSYNEGEAYFKSVTAAEWTYDDMLSDLEVIFDPARGGNSSKLALCSLPVISQFNKMGDGGFIDNSTASTQAQYMIERAQGSFGHRVTKVDTIHGDITLIKEPLFRGLAAGFMCMVDLDHVSYRPLVGNGLNRDTHIVTNVQSDDEDLRKDMILTEAGLEVSLPETHALFNLEGV
tara:strand:+ start:42 stop:1385 length:1344 start_codon:yes stop_codon:yes gene_type:complete